MPLNLKYSATVKNAKLDAIATAVGASGLLRIYSGTQPTNPDTGLAGNTLLAELPCSATFAPSASGGSPAVKQKLSVSFTPQMKGVVKARIYVARASTTVYIDPLITIT
jgi:hypothetical protein